jgi:hypothetical protein
VRDPSLLLSSELRVALDSAGFKVEEHTARQLLLGMATDHEGRVDGLEVIQALADVYRELASQIGAEREVTMAAERWKGPDSPDGFLRGTRLVYPGAGGGSSRRGVGRGKTFMSVAERAVVKQLPKLKVASSGRKAGQGLLKPFARRDHFDDGESVSQTALT